AAAEPAVVARLRPQAVLSVVGHTMANVVLEGLQYPWEIFRMHPRQPARQHFREFVDHTETEQLLLTGRKPNGRVRRIPRRLRHGPRAPAEFQPVDSFFPLVKHDK